MKMTTKINTMLLKYAEEVEQAILAGEFEYLSHGDFTTDILVLGDRVSIWMSNGPEKTRCHALCGEHAFDFPDNSFSQGEKCRELIMASFPDADDTEEHN